MTPTIRIDEEVYALLKERAEPFVDTPNSVLRKLLELPNQTGAGTEVDSERSLNKEGLSLSNKPEEPSSPRRRKASRRNSKRAVRGTLVPQAAYELPILQVLREKGGRAPSREVIDALEPHLAGKLKSVDRSKTSSGEIRWRNRAQFVRLDLIEKGQLAKNSPRGVWEITEAGMRRAKAG